MRMSSNHLLIDHQEVGDIAIDKGENPLDFLTFISF